jgi:8-oxo-dGTP pyrophosphatase MutT (NUDIX family)
LSTLPAQLSAIVERLRARGSRTPPVEGAIAAVATIFRQGPRWPEILFIERAKRDGDPWSGHIAFPGGRRDAADASLLATAMRETREEVGLRLDPGSLVVRLDDFVALSFATQVAQFVFALEGDGGPLVASAEVASMLWTPIDVLRAPENAGTYQFVHDGQTIELPSVHLGPRVLWGMTHRMVQALIDAWG